MSIQIKVHIQNGRKTCDIVIQTFPTFLSMVWSWSKANSDIISNFHPWTGRSRVTDTHNILTRLGAA